MDGTQIRDEKAEIGVMLAGVGYTSVFTSQKVEYPDIQDVKVYLLTLEDVLAKTQTYEEALKDLPKLDNVGEKIVSGKM